MATFEIQFGGKTFEVDAPHQDAALEAFRQFQPTVAPKAERGPWDLFRQPPAAGGGSPQLPAVATPSYSMDQLETALINADKAGDTEGARTLAAQIQRQRANASSSGPWDAFPRVQQPMAARPTPHHQIQPDDIKVTGPDGSIIHFPKDTPEHVMTRALSEHYPADNRWWEKAPLADRRSFSKPTRLDIDGYEVEVDERFLTLSPDEQGKAVDEIWAEIRKSGKPPLTIEQRRARAAGERPSTATPSTMEGFLPPDVQGSTGPAVGPGIGAEVARVGRGIDQGVRTFADGLTLGTGDKAAANVRSWLGADYDKTLAAERAYTKQAAEDQGPVGSAFLRGAGNVAGLTAAQAAGVPVFGVGGMGLLGRTATAAGTMGALGAGAGAINADGDAEAKVKAALLEGGIHAGAGAAGPLIGAGVGAVARPIMSWLRPESEAVRRVAAAMMESRKTPPEIAESMRTAALEGQPQFALADAIGNPGGRLLTTATKQPGPAREFAREALEQRQAGQARRLGQFLEEGFQAPETAAQATARLTAQRAEEGAKNYALARQDAGAVDVSGALKTIDKTLLVNTVVSRTSNLADDTVEAALHKARSLLAYEGTGKAAAGQASAWGAYNRGAERVVDFQAAHRAMMDIGDMADAAMRAGRNNQARLLGEVRKEMDSALVKASPSYSAARDAYASGSRQIEAVEGGAAAATRGRSEDVIRSFNALSPEEQAAFRHGYADKYITGAQGAAAGTNAARPLTADAVRQEFPVIAGGERGDRLMRQIERENQMAATRQNALGGSSTAENFADAASVAPGVVESLMRGNVANAGAQLLGKAVSALQGNNKAQIQEMARILMERDPNILSRLTDRVEASEGVKRIARTMLQLGLRDVGDRALNGSGR